MEFIYFKHKETDGVFEAPDEPGVRERYEALGWEEQERPKPGPFVPAPGNDAPDAADGEWVVLQHKETHATHDFPNNEDALQGAFDAGWSYPPKPKAKPPVEESKPEPKAKASAKAVAEEEK